ncbi:MAG TPA: hypothetical protein DGR79_06430 [Clostridiales bacterium]|nr:hypothetical protein [Clostridiales bacterium]
MPRNRTGRTRRVAAAVLVLTLFGTAAVLPADTAVVSAARGMTWKPLLYDVTVTYDPRTLEMSVTCVLDVRVVRNRDYRLALRGYFQIEEAELDGVPAEVRRGRTWNIIEVSRPPRTSEFGELKRWVVSYRGTPERYDREQDRYWAWATEEAVWLCWALDWLPVEAGVWLPDDYWTKTGFRLSVSVPEDWVVLSPGSVGVREVSGGVATYRFDKRYGDEEAYPPVVILAGPYRLCGTGSAEGVSYTVWGLPKWSDAAQDLFEEMGPMLEYFHEVIGRLPETSPERPLTAVQVPPEQGGGVAWPGQNFMVVAAEGQRYRFGDEGDPRDLWAHELAHLVVPGFDDGLVDFLALDYLRYRDPVTFELALTCQMRYFLEAVEEHGDRAILPAMEARAGGEEVPEVHAFLYTKPALVWNMFHRLFGEETTYAALRRFIDIHRRFQDTDHLPFSDGCKKWFDMLRQAIGEEAGEEAVRFLDAWYLEAHPVDLAVADVVCRETRDGDWTLAFNLVDEHGSGTPPARESVPLVDVVVVTEAGGSRTTHTREVVLTGDRIEVEFTFPARPVSVTLAPWVLDYDRSDNHAAPERPAAPADKLGTATVAGAVLLAVLAAVHLYRRRPGRVQSPPMAGSAPGPRG